MKKNYFIVLIALLAFALNNYAQDDASQNNTYNMVVKLPDGTTFTINTDDVDEVSFSNGEVIVSGQTLTDLLQRISRQDNRIDSLGMVSDDKYIMMRAEMGNAMSEMQFYMINYMSEMQQQLSANQIDIEWLKQLYSAFETTIDNLASRCAYQYVAICELEAKIATLEAAIAELTKDKQEQKKPTTTESLK